MTISDLTGVFVFLVLLAVAAPLLGNYMYRVFEGEEHFMQPVLGWLERIIYRLCGISSTKETGWQSYTFSMLVFNFAGMLILFSIQLLQGYLPLNPEGLPAVRWDLALNTSISFMTNTNWQSYAGETTLSYLVQMAGLTVQNFLSAATGIAVLAALSRGIVRRAAETIGNFWVDLTRSVVYILLPLSILLALILAGEGAVQNFRGHADITTLEGKHQEIPMGPVASQVAIKQLGTNGGGYFNTNSAHPFENPSPLSNFLEMLAILLIPAALTFTYGKMTSSTRHGRVIFIAMLIMLLTGLSVALWSEYSGNPVTGNLSLMEGKEMRTGITGSVLWAVSTTAASNGSVNAMMSSLSPISTLVALLNILMGEVVFGGVGSGLYGMVAFIILTVFIAGLMVGRTPEYLGKKIEAFEVQMALAAVLIPGFVILLMTMLAVLTKAGLSSLSSPGPHGFSEILYAFSSAAGNNGSAFAGLNSNTVFYNLALGISMLLGRFGVIVPMMAIAGSLVRKKITPASEGTFRTDNMLFGLLLITVILIIGGLTFFPVLAFGPVAEHILMINGITF